MSDTLFRAKAPGIMNLLMADFGLDVESAAAILGNLGHESGGFSQMQELAPTVAGSAGGWGWAQWTGPRRRAFEDYADRNGYPRSSDTANYKWLFIELSGSERGAISAVKNAVGLEAKVKAFEMAFERAGVKHYDKRNQWALIALEAYRANPGGRLDIQDAPAVLPQSSPSPPPVLPANPLAAIFPALQTHQADARKIVLGVVGAYNLLYPDDIVVVQNAKPEAPKGTPVSQRPSVQLGITGLLGSLIGMATGQIGTPFGLGAEPTTAGTLSTLIPVAISAIGATGGGWAGLIGPALKIIGGLANKAKSS